MILMPLTSRQGISGVALMTASGNLVAMSPNRPTDDSLARQTQRALSIPALFPEAHQFGCCIGCISQICQKVIDSSGHRSTASARM
jgi:hypothetical protein